MPLYNFHILVSLYDCIYYVYIYYVEYMDIYYASIIDKIASIFSISNVS